MLASIPLPMYGSPPRGWGKRVCCIHHPRPHTVHPHAGGENQGLSSADVLAARFTPTRVGKTCLLSKFYVCCAVHPHAGGENIATAAAKSALDGSPPRGWGKPGTEQCGCPRGTVHPHAGGENLSPFKVLCVLCGSPPRGWGKHSHGCRQVSARRFTPTRVGKTRGAGRFGQGGAVHPHAGGENALKALFETGDTRFTPTRVGKTFIS